MIDKPTRPTTAHIREAAEFLRSKTRITPTVGIILGTGMGRMASEVIDASIIPYDQIPHYCYSTVESHLGKLHLGTMCDVSVMMMQGRLHYYEGYSMQQITFPVRVMKEMGCEILIVMNAVGSMNSLIPSGSLVLVNDHINLMGDNPLIGPNDDSLGPRFPDMSQPYDRQLVALAEKVAVEERIGGVHRGVMVAVTGPNMETAAEYRMFQRIGADIVTMSTVPEVLVANHGGMRVLAISAVTDECLPDALHPVSLDTIIKVAGEAEPRFTALVKGVLKQLP